MSATTTTVVVGGGLAVATLVGVVTSQTSAPEKSPGTIESPDFSYGATQ